MSIKDEEKAIDEAVARFPKEFGLRAFPGDRFKIERWACYWDDDRGGTLVEGRVVQVPGPVLYVYVKRGDQWLAFAKGTEQELKKELVTV